MIVLNMSVSQNDLDKITSENVNLNVPLEIQLSFLLFTLREREHRHIDSQEAFNSKVTFC